METMKTIAKRKSVRKFKPDLISDEDLNAILAAGCAAPVGMKQYDSLHLTVIQDKAVLNQLGGGISRVMGQAMKKEINEPFDFYHAPTAVMISSKPQMIPGIDYANAANVTENMMLAATDIGIGSCVIWGAGVAAATDAQLKSKLAIPDDFTPLFSIVLGNAEKENDEEKDLKINISINRI